MQGPNEINTTINLRYTYGNGPKEPCKQITVTHNPSHTSFLEAVTRALESYMQDGSFILTNSHFSTLYPPGQQILDQVFAQLPDLSKIDFSGINFNSKEDIEWLADTLKNLPLLTSINVSNINLGPQGLEILLPALTQLKKLQYLDISYNSLNQENIELLARLLPELSCIQCICLRAINLGPEGLQTLSPALIQLQQLQELDLSFNSLSPNTFLCLTQLLAAIEAFNKTLPDLNTNLTNLVNQYLPELLAPLLNPSNITNQSINLQNQLNTTIAKFMPNFNWLTAILNALPATLGDIYGNLAMILDQSSDVAQLFSNLYIAIHFIYLDIPCKIEDVLRNAINKYKLNYDITPLIQTLQPLYNYYNAFAENNTIQSCFNYLIASIMQDVGAWTCELNTLLPNLAFLQTLKLENNGLMHPNIKTLGPVLAQLSQLRNICLNNNNLHLMPTPPDDFFYNSLRHTCCKDVDDNAVADANKAVDEDEGANKAVDENNDLAKLVKAILDKLTENVMAQAIAKLTGDIIAQAKPKPNSLVLDHIVSILGTLANKVPLNLHLSCEPNNNPRKIPLDFDLVDSTNILLNLPSFRDDAVIELLLQLQRLIKNMLGEERRLYEQLCERIYVKESPTRINSRCINLEDSGYNNNCLPNIHTEHPNTKPFLDWQQSNSPLVVFKENINEILTLLLRVMQINIAGKSSGSHIISLYVPSFTYLLESCRELCNLHGLDLSGIPLNLAQAKELASYLKCFTHLRALNLSNTNLNLDAIKALVPILKNLFLLRILNLTSNDLPEEAIRILSNLVEKTLICKLHVSSPLPEETTQTLKCNERLCQQFNSTLSSMLELILASTKRRKKLPPELWELVFYQLIDLRQTKAKAVAEHPAANSSIIDMRFM